jgi:hypothetical protein
MDDKKTVREEVLDEAMNLPLVQLLSMAAVGAVSDDEVGVTVQNKTATINIKLDPGWELQYDNYVINIVK